MKASKNKGNITVFILELISCRDMKENSAKSCAIGDVIGNRKSLKIKTFGSF